MKNLIKEIKEARENKGFTQTQVADKLGIGLRMYQKIEDGQFPKYKKEQIQKLDSILETNFYEHIYELNIQKNTNTKSNAKPVHETEFMEVPVITIVGYGGFLKGFADPEYNESLETMLLPKEYDKGNYKVFEYQGDSMNDGSNRSFLDGDYYLCKELTKEYWRFKLHYKDYLFVVVSKDNGIQYVQITKHDVEKGTITCHKWNVQYEDYIENLKDVQLLFYVKKLVQRKIKF